ncbi:MAG: MFS transporter [Chloroflexi bacterium]|nr:MFS transporter [Chloroflexota bacterium]
MRTLRLASGTRVYYGWIIVAVTFVVLFVSSGVQHSFGVFFKPMVSEFGWDRASISLAVSINQIVFGLVQPVMGKLVDRHGAKIVILVGLVLMMSAIVAMSTTSGLLQLYLLYGLLSAAGMGAMSTVTTSTLLASWFTRGRGLVLSISTAGISAGQFVIIPTAMYVILLVGWRPTYLLLGLVLALSMPMVFWLIKNKPSELGLLPDGDRLRDAGRDRPLPIPGDTSAQERRTPIARAMKDFSFWMLVIEFFVCGFTGAMIATHLVPTATDRGIPEIFAANALGLAGGFSVLGVLVTGAISDRVGRKNPLAAIFFVRGLALVYLLILDDPVGLTFFAAFYGLARIATVPLTSALAAEIFGKASMGTIFGVIYLSHQVGGSIGSYLAGRVFDVAGSYTSAFVAAIIACFIATGASFLVKESRSAASELGKGAIGAA